MARRAAESSVQQCRRDVFESHRHRVFSLAFYMTGNELEAEEIVSNTFIHAFEQAERPDAFVVDSMLIEELRGRFPLEREQPAAKVHEDSDVRCGQVLRTELEDAIRTLPARERLLFLLRDVEGYSLEAIAKLLGSPEPPLRRALFSAHLRLRQNLAAPASARSAPEAA